MAADQKELPGGSRLRRILPLPVVLILVLAVSLHFCLWKSGMFIDEIYTFGLSNSHNMPFIGNGEHDRIEEQLITRADFQDYLTVTDSEPAFDAVSVYTNQVQDVHPPLHYWIINFCSSLARGQFSKWIGLIPDLIIQAGTLVLLYLLGIELFHDRRIAALTALLFGLSQAGLSIVLMIRMYVLMCFWTVLLALLIAKELRAPGLKKEIGIGLCIFAGLMTQYYFVFYAFFLCAVTVFVLLFRKDFRAAGRFALLAFLGVGLMLLCFPAVLTQMTGQRLGPDSDALENLKNVSAWAGRLRYYFGQIRVGLPVAVGAAVASLVVTLGPVLMRKIKPQFTGDELRVLWLLLPVLPTVFVSALIAPVVEGRYVYNIMPICVLAAGWCISVYVRCADAPQQSAEDKVQSSKFKVQIENGKMNSEFSRRSLSWCLTLAALAVVWSLRTVPDYIYDEHREYNAIVEEHADDPCVYMTEYYAGVTQDMLQLIRFEDVYVAGDPASAGLAEYLDAQNCDECVVYIDVSDFWGSGFNAAEMLDDLLSETDYTSYEPLYHYALSNTYLLRK